MKVDIENVKPCKVKVLVKLEATEARPVWDRVLNTYVRNGRVPGFRPGKAPLAIIMKNFGERIAADAKEELFRQTYQKALKESGVNAIALTNVGQIALSPETGASFDMEFDVRPEFDLPKYQKINIEEKKPEVTDAQVEDRIQRQRKVFAKFADAAEADAIKDGDMVEIDFESTADGKPVTEVSPDAVGIASRKGFWLQIDKERFLPEVVEGLVGLKAGDKKEIKFKFAKDFPDEALAGKKAVFNVEVKKIRSCTLPDDTELCKSLKVDDMAALKTKTREAMQNAAEMDELHRREVALQDALLKKNEFELPESQVAEETNSVIQKMLSNLQYQGVTKEQIEEGRAELLDAATQTAKRNLRLVYIYAAIADAEKIEVSDEEYKEKVAQLAKEFQTTAEELEEQIKKNGRTSFLRSQIRTEKTVKFLLGLAKGK